MTPAAARVRVLVGLFVALALPLTAVADGALAEVPANPALLIESLFRSARYDSVLAVVDDALGRAQATGDSVLLGRMLTQRGRVYLMTGRLAEAELAIATGIQIARSVRDTTGWMPALTFKGYALASMGRLDEAVACYERRLFLARHVRSLLDEAWALTNTGYVRLQRGQLVHAREDYERAIALFRQGGRTDLELTPLIGLGRTLSALGATHEAGRCYQRAWIVAREIGDRENEMWATNNLGAIESVTGDMGRAHQYASRAHLIAKEMGYARGAVAPAINIATWITELGEYQRAAEILAEARELCERTGSREYIAKLDYQRASLLLAPREPRAAAAEFRRLLREGRLDPLDADYARIGLAVALAAADSAPAAIELLEPLLASGQPWHAEPEMSAHLVLSRLLARQGDYAASLVHATRAREAADKLGWRRFAVSARLRESASLRALGRREKARVSLAAALDSLEVARGVVRRAEWREAFGQGLTGDVFDACQVLLEEPESIPRPARERVFFDTIQRFKARTLAERISEPRAGAVPSAAASARPPGLEQLQADVLRNDELFIDIVAGPVASYLFAITSDSLRLVPLPGSGSPLAPRVQT
ncbi:MAG: tetratricopeptide repeat protein, partial [Candidatus Krumholzibacteria bacterium]|nr:tetratricopeptide repeat protein [Candidatus Krumholzibacteria bacterium]